MNNAMLSNNGTEIENLYAISIYCSYTIYNYNHIIYNCSYTIYNYSGKFRSFEWFYIRQLLVLAGKIIDAPGRNEI